MQRRGAVLFAVLVCLLVVSGLTIQLARAALMHQRQLRVQQYATQSYWLAHSACRRAIARLQTDPQYTGETWKIDAGELSGHDASVVIWVRQVEVQLDKRRVTVEATYPSDNVHRASTRKELVVSIRNE